MEPKSYQGEKHKGAKNSHSFIRSLYRVLVTFAINSNVGFKQLLMITAGGYAGCSNESFMNDHGRHATTDSFKLHKTRKYSVGF